MVVYNYDSGNNGYDLEVLLGQVLGTQKWPWTKNAAKNALTNCDYLIKKAIVNFKDNMAATTTDF